MSKDSRVTGGNSKALQRDLNKHLKAAKDKIDKAKKKGKSCEVIAGLQQTYDDLAKRKETEIYKLTTAVDWQVPIADIPLKDNKTLMIGMQYGVPLAQSSETQTILMSVPNNVVALSKFLNVSERDLLTKLKSKDDWIYPEDG